MSEKHKVFISYHHENDQCYKSKLIQLNDKHGIFIDESVNTGDIGIALKDKTIRTKIRDEYLKNTTVTIVLVGSKTNTRKHIDWEIHSSMINGSQNKKSGILVITLDGNDIVAPHGDNEKSIYGTNISSENSTREEYIKKFPSMPNIIIDNLVNDECKISVVPWKYIKDNPARLSKLINFAYDDRKECEYDLSRDMRKKNS